MKFKIVIIMLGLVFIMGACGKKNPANKKNEALNEKFKYVADEFADLKIIRYQVPGWEELSLQQKKLAYYLVQAGLSGRDIMWDQNYRHNLKIRRALENVAEKYTGDKTTADWKNFMEYTKRIWFSNGIHHHYSSDKFIPGFPKKYFEKLLQETLTELSDEIVNILFDPSIDAKKTNFDPEKGLVKGSAINFYDPEITEKEVDAFYQQMIDATDKEPISYGLNSKLVRKNGQIKEKVWKLGGMYSTAIEKIIYWLEKAVEVAENQPQADALKLLIKYYQTGDLKIWDEYSIAWTKATDGDIDYINGFIEVYDDPKGYRASYETIVQINDFDMSKRMSVLSEYAQWFEQNSTINKEHKKENVVGVSYKVVNVAGEAGATSPSTPIGVNLPNANWIRAQHGSKSVSLGNIVYAYGKAGGDEIVEEFNLSEEVIKRAKKHGKIAGKMHTALHEVIGHASGKINKGVGTPKETLKNYSSQLEEARADMVAMYYLMDPKLVDLGLMESLEVGKASYDQYIRNGIMTQLIRIEPGKNIEQAHMRSRQTGASWAYKRGKAENVIEKIVKDEKTYFQINDYQKLRTIFGELLKEIQRIKSEGDYEAGKSLIEGYGVKVDADLHKEVLARNEKLDIKPYGGFINPQYEVIKKDEEITDINITYPDSFEKQMLYYAKNYSFLPDEN